MAKKLIILCHVDALAGYVDADCQATCTMNLAAAFDYELTNDPTHAPTPTPTLDEIRHLRPWDWTMDRLRFFRPETHDLDFVDFDPPPSVPSSLVSFKNRLDQALTDTYPPSESVKLFHWGGPGSLTKSLPSAEAAPQDRRVHWTHVLAQLSQYPYPLPHAINLVRSFKLPLGADVVAAPVIEFKDGTTCTPTTSVKPVPVNGTNFTYYEWKYDRSPLPGYDLVAHVAATKCVCDTCSPGQIIDRGTQWAKVPTNTQPLDDDWRATLENDVAVHFDSAQRLIDAMRDALASEARKKLFEAELPALRNVLATLLWESVDARGTTVLGAIEKSVAHVMLEDLDPKPDTILETLKGFRPANTAWLETWRRVLRGSLRSGAGAFALSPQSQILTNTLENEVSQHEQLQSALADDESLLDVILAAWTEALTPKPSANPQAASPVAPAPSIQPEHKRAIDYARTRAATLNLRSRLLRQSLRPHWLCVTAIVDDGPDELAQIRANVEHEIVAFTTERIASAEATSGSTLAKIRPAIEQSIAEYAKKAAKPIGTSSKKVRPTPQAVVLQVDRVKQRADNDGDDPDLLRRISGVGVLMRQTGTNKPWQCLNIADASLPSRDAQTPATRLTTVLVPAPLHDSDGLRQAFISYDNQSIVAEGPAARLANQFAPESLTAEPRAFDRLLQYTTPGNTAPSTTGTEASSDAAARKTWSWSRLPQLTYGRSYEAAVFYLSNGGALPKELTDGTNPFQIVERNNNFELGSTIDRFAFPYVRQVPIGPIRAAKALAAQRETEQEALQDPRTRKVPSPFPPLPQNVALRASALAKLATTTKEAPDEFADSEATAPIVLLTPDGWKGNSFVKFPLYRPTVDLQNWDRWVTYDDTEAVHASRRAVWAEYFERGADNFFGLANGGGLSTIDHNGIKSLALDDPAVASFIHIEMTVLGGYENNNLPRIREARAGKPDVLADSGKSHNFDLAIHKPELGGGIDALAAEPAWVTVSCGPGGAQAADPTLTQAQLGTNQVDVIVRPISKPGETSIGGREEMVIVVPAGIVLEVKAHAVIEKAHRDQRFSADAVADFQRKHPTKTDFHIGSAYRVLIETATDRMPKPEEVHRRLFTKFDEGTSTLHAVLRADTTKDNFRFVSRAEIIRQAWRWTGRVLNPFPAQEWCLWQQISEQFDKSESGGGFDPSQALQEWEGEAFGERPESDHLVAPFVLHKPANEKALPYYYREDLSGSPQAAYYRLAARVFSRYEPLFPDPADEKAQPQPPFVESWIDSKPVPAGRTENPRQWLRLPIPCRYENQLPKPALKMLLPLTDVETRSNLDVDSSGKPRPSASPGLLAVFSGSWYQIGGLAESLAVEVEIADKPDSESNKEGFTKLFQLGPDPIVSGEEYRCGDQSPQAMPRPRIDPIGPIGHTRERGSDSSFTSTSFILPAPVAEEDGKTVDGRALRKGEQWPVDQWDFVKVKFARRVEPAAMANTSAPPPLGELTSGHWIQYLPALTMVVDEPLWTNLRVKLKDDRTLEIIGKDKTVDIRRRQAESDCSLIEPYLVITKPVQETSGRSGHEVFVTILRSASNEPSWSPFDDYHDALPARLRARVIQVQWSSQRDSRPPSRLQDLWDALYPENPKKDVQARIVRVSPAIPTPDESEASTQ